MLLHGKYIRASYLYSGVIVTGIFVYQKDFLFLILNQNFIYYIINLLHVKTDHGHTRCGLGCSVPIIPFGKNDHFGGERITTLFSHSLALVLPVLVTFALSFVIEIYIRKLGMFRPSPLPGASWDLKFDKLFDNLFLSIM